MKIEELKKLISISGHDIRTVLGGTNWALQAFLDGDLGSMNQEQKEYLEEMAKNNAEAIRLINELLNIAQAENMPIEKKESIDVNDLVEKALAMFRQSAKKQKIDALFDKTDLPKIMAYQRQVKIILTNLIDNALRYTLSGGKVIVKTQKKDNNIEISIKDTGIGIPEKDKEKVFEKFFRSENAAKKERFGTGLGLYITRELVLKNGGKIWFESKENTGSTFYFTLPLTPGVGQG